MKRNTQTVSAQVFKRVLAVAVLLAIALLAIQPVRAESGWQNNVALYLVGAGLEGTIGIGPVEGDVDLSFSELWENLDGGLMLAYRGETDKFAVVVDLIALDVSNSETSDNGLLKTEIGLKERVYELDGMYRFHPNWEVYGGLRYWDIDASLSIKGQSMGVVDFDGSTGASWTDPLVGLRASAPIGGNWSFIGRGDVGGFGVGSDFSWNLMLLARWQPTKVFSLALGYRGLATDYEDGSGTDRIKIDVVQQGPAIGAVFTF